jgi:hypothetical protein
MKNARLFLLFLLISITSLGLFNPSTHHTPTVSYAQADEACNTVVQQALSQAANVCLNMGRNEACLASLSVTSILTDSSLFFQSPGDIIPVEALQSVITLPADPNTSEWGIVIMDLAVDLPEDSDGVVRLLLYGGVQVSSDTQNVSNQFNAPMQAINVQMDETASCRTTPSGMLIQSPSGQTATLMVNNVELRVGSTALLTTQNDNGRLTIANLQGNVSITTKGVSRDVDSGYESYVEYEDDGDWGEPFDPYEFGDEYDDFDFDELDDIFDLEDFDAEWFDNPFVLIDGYEDFDADVLDGICDVFDTSHDCIDAFYDGEIDGYDPHDYFGDFDCLGSDCFDYYEEWDDEEYFEDDDFDEEFDEEFDDDFEDDEFSDEEFDDEAFSDDEFFDDDEFE